MDLMGPGRDIFIKMTRPGPINYNIYFRTSPAKTIPGYKYMHVAIIRTFSRKNGKSSGDGNIKELEEY